MPPPYYPSSEREYHSFPPEQIYCPPSQSSFSTHGHHENEQTITPASEEPTNFEQSSDTRRVRDYCYNARLGPIGNIINLAAVTTSRAAANASNSALRSTLGFVANFLTSHTTERRRYDAITAAEQQHQQQLYERQWQEQPFVYF